MKKNQGWVALHRTLQDHFLWDDKPFSKGQAWIDLILLANHEDTKQLYQGKIVEFKRGTVNRSISSLAERWGWDRKKVRRFFKILELEKMATINASKHRTTITLVNYDFYQGMGATNNPNNDTMTTPTNGQPLPIYNNDNNDNNEEQYNSVRTKSASIKKSHKFIEPTLEEVQNYVNENHYNVDAQTFLDYYAARGWVLSNGRKAKDWKACLRIWNRNNQKWNKKEVEVSEQRSEYAGFKELFKR